MRPRKWDRAELLQALLDYIEDTEIPILAEFAYQHGIYRQRLYEWEEFADAIKVCTAKKEAQLERLALAGKVNVAMAIFSLKQLGWKDTHEQTHVGDKERPIMIMPSDANL
jgi:hypothetical protein